MVGEGGDQTAKTCDVSQVSIVASARPVDHCSPSQRAGGEPPPTLLPQSPALRVSAALEHNETGSEVVPP